MLRRHTTQNTQQLYKQQSTKYIMQSQKIPFLSLIAFEIISSNLYPIPIYIKSKHLNPHHKRDFLDSHMKVNFKLKYTTSGPFFLITENLIQKQCS